MSSVVAYQNSDRQCFCQIKFSSGERLLISIATLPMPSVRIIRMGLGGLIPRNTIWQYSAKIAGSAGAYAENLLKMFPPFGQSVHPLDVIRDILLQCSSIAECRRVLADRQERIDTPDILTLYGDLLQRSGIIEPESSLPASKNEIKAALIAEARRLSAVSNFDAIEALRTCYSLLAGFVSDDIAARNRGADSAEGVADIDGLQPDDLLATSEEAQRLIREFDSQVPRR